MNFVRGKILLPEDHPELDNFINEYLYFPRGRHDDILYATELAIELVTTQKGTAKTLKIIDLTGGY